MNVTFLVHRYYISVIRVRVDYDLLIHLIFAYRTECQSIGDSPIFQTHDIISMETYVFSIFQKKK